MEPGYGSPIGAHDTVVVVDDLVARSSNLVAGANREGFHYRNVNVGRDFTADVVADLTNAQRGRSVPDLRPAGDPAQRHRGRQHLQARDEVHATRSGATYLGEDGVAHPIVMGSYGIGIGRNVACIVEAHHDDKGIVWPAEVAPYAAHLVSIGARQGPAGHRDRRAPARARARGRSRDPVGRPRRIARRQVHRRRAARHALDPDGQPALAGGRRGRGHGAGDRRAVDPLDRGRSRRCWRAERDRSRSPFQRRWSTRRIGLHQGKKVQPGWNTRRLRPRRRSACQADWRSRPSRVA